MLFYQSHPCKNGAYFILRKEIETVICSTEFMADNFQLQMCRHFTKNSKLFAHWLLLQSINEVDPGWIYIIGPDRVYPLTVCLLNILMTEMIKSQNWKSVEKP